MDSGYQQMTLPWPFLPGKGNNRISTVQTKCAVVDTAHTWLFGANQSSAKRLHSGHKLRHCVNFSGSHFFGDITHHSRRIVAAIAATEII